MCTIVKKYILCVQGVYNIYYVYKRKIITTNKNNHIILYNTFYIQIQIVNISTYHKYRECILDKTTNTQALHN